MTITRKFDGNEAVFSLQGRLDTLTAPEATEKLVPAFDETEHVVLDFTELEYISSAGLRVLLAAKKKADAVKGSLVIRNVPSQVMSVLEMTGINQVLKIV